MSAAANHSRYPEHMSEFEIALNTGMRPSEQIWTGRVARGFGAQLPNPAKRKTGKRATYAWSWRRLRKRSLNGEGSVFVNIQGEALRGYEHWLIPAVEEAGLKDFTWCCLRHTFASRLAMTGVSRLSISGLMRYKTIQMTKRYAHLAPAHNQAAVDRLVQFRADPAASVSPTDTVVAPSLRATMIRRRRVWSKWFVLLWLS